LKTVLIAIFAVSLITLGFSHSASAQLQAGGVNKEGSWYVGEGLKKGDLYSYDLCHVYYKDCTQFRIDFWVEGDEQVGSENQWKLQVLVKESGKTLRGTINLGKIAAEPIGSTKNLIPHAAAFKSSLSWLSAYATGDPQGLTGKGPKQFTMTSWGKIGNIGGEQIIPTAEEKIAVPAGIFDTVRVTWKTGGKVNNVWVVDGFPFPVKADTYAHVSSGIPPQEYRFELLDFQRDVKKNPFPEISTGNDGSGLAGCPKPTDTFTQVSKNTNTNTMIIDVKYSPKSPKQGCEMDMIIDFKRKVNQEEFENEVHYDILVVKPTTSGLPDVLRSFAADEKRNAFFTTSGQVRTTIDVKESGKTTYAILVKGTGPETAPDPATIGFITFDVDVQAGTGTVTTPDTTPKPGEIVIPSWIKTNAKFWAEGKITDRDFVSGIQYLINNKIIKIPTSASTGTQSTVIPAWVKDAAGFWADGKTTDKDFVNGLQYLITNGIIKLKS
jgi:hypothetical protein